MQSEENLTLRTQRKQQVSYAHQDPKSHPGIEKYINHHNHPNGTRIAKRDRETIAALSICHDIKLCYILTKRNINRTLNLHKLGPFPHPPWLLITPKLKT